MLQNDRTPSSRRARMAGALLVMGAATLSLCAWTSPAGASEQSQSASAVAATGTKASIDTAAAEAEFLVAINGARAMMGSPALMAHPPLQVFARAQAQAMASQQRLFHSDLNVLMGVWSRAGENIGYGGSVTAIHNALMASPAHWDNLMNPTFTYVAIGVAVDANGNIWTSHVFVG